MRELQTAKEAKVNGLRCDNKMGRQDPEFTFLSGSLWNSGLFLTNKSWSLTKKNRVLTIASKLQLTLI